MDNELDPELVQACIDRCLVLGLKSQAGEDVVESIKGTVDEAFELFDTRAKGVSIAHKHRFAAQLRMLASLVGQAIPQQAKVLMDAHTRASEKLARRDFCNALRTELPKPCEY